MAVDATNPNLAPASIKTRRFDLLDAELVLREVSAAAISTTTNEDSIEFKAEKDTYYKAVVLHNAIGGTVDGSNYWTVSIQFSDDNTNWVTAESVRLAAAANKHYLALDGAGVEKLMDAAGEGEAIYARAIATETGTTAGNLAYGAYFTC